MNKKIGKKTTIIILFILFLVACYLRLTNFGAEINIFDTFIFIIFILLISWAVILHQHIRENFFKKSFSFSYSKIPPQHNVHTWLESRFNLALFLPHFYFKKEHLWEGYLLYLVSIFFTILAILFFVFYLINL